MTDDRFSIVPRPVRLEPGVGSFDLAAATAIVAHPDALAAAADLRDLLAAGAGCLDLVPDSVAAEPRPRTILLTTVGATPALGPEGYTIDVRPDGVVLRSATPAGLFYAVQTLRQLRPGDARALPAVRVTDQPRYPYRGFMLDCSRHFMDVGFVKRAIDLMAYHKLNTFHWHLTDNNGWRLQLDRYPRLTTVGASREWGVPDRPPVFYTKDEVRDVLAHAAARHVTVIPEIEMPGHCAAALAADPDLRCQGGDAFCAGNDAVFDFLIHVLDEVADLFPAPLVHVGGDERPKGVWERCPLCQARMREHGIPDEHELQNWFMARVSDHLAARGKRPMSWAYVKGDPYDPTDVADLGHGAVVQNWHGGTALAARRGLDVVNSDNTRVYLDYPEFPALQPLKPDWMFLLPLDKVYAFDPTPAGLTPEQERHVLGTEACLWTEFVPQAGADYQTFPRLAALAEVAWTPRELKDYRDFTRRLATHTRRLEKMGVQIATPSTRPVLIEPPRKQ